jgi:hypothetical protein
VPKHLLNDPERHALGEQERSACVARVVEPLARQAGRGECPLIAVRNGRGVERRPDRTCKNEVEILPRHAYCEPLLELAAPMIFECSQDWAWHEQRAAALGGLRLHQLYLPAETLQRVTVARPRLYPSDGVTAPISALTPPRSQSGARPEPTLADDAYRRLSVAYRPGDGSSPRIGRLPSVNRCASRGPRRPVSV